MKILLQTLVALAVITGAVALWVAYVPAARPWLDRAGVSALIGLPPAPTGGTSGGGAAGGGAAGPRARGGPVAVVADPVGTALMNDSARAIGDGRALRAVTVMPQVAGQITAVNATSGSRVESGFVLAQLEDEAQKIALEQARLTLADTQETLKRQQRLGTSGATAISQIQEAQLQVRTAELGVRKAEFELGQRKIRAPFAGWVGLISAEVGDQVTPSSEIAQIDDRSTLLVDFRLPERYVGQLAEGLSVTATSLARTDVALTGRIRALDNRVDEASRTILVEAELANPEDRLRAGMAFAIRVDLPGDQVPTVPPLAVQWSGEGPFVWVVAEGKARRLALQILQRNADAVLVRADFRPGDRVVTEGVQMLRPGSAVQIVAGDGAQAAAGPGGGAGQPAIARPQVSQ
ncbi:efflux RND transporter periplasmic adaptor subunit [Acidimangrovimonas sediminis]|uniref:efflux RND transporter periplasmic adaptor subunit n=1 Tax=Acidimangrovimonas sediminis TaxID=2056283 RepID=UPI000C809227|nr:efflux RND transporter periplasmic adaptor subunit [Acidimangrovimonas sediminis]